MSSSSAAAPSASPSRGARAARPPRHRARARRKPGPARRRSPPACSRRSPRRSPPSCRCCDSAWRARRLSGVRAGAPSGTGMDPGYLRCGTLLAARDADEATLLARELELRQSLGLTVHRLRASEARRLEPALAPTLRLALEIPDDHAIDPRKLTAALAQALTAAGGELRLGAPVNGVTTSGDRITGVRLDDGSELPAGDVVVAAGPWSSTLDGIPDGAQSPSIRSKARSSACTTPRAGPAHPGAANDRRLPGPARRRALRARRDDGGARLRHDRDRRRRVRPAAQRDSSCCRR